MYGELFFVSLIVILWLAVQLYSVKVYRFYSPKCGYCVASQKEWDKFKTQCTLKLIKCIDVNVEANDANMRFAKDFGVTSWPTVILVTLDGRQFVHTGERTAASYMKFVSSH